tara:strand:- start:944 stop:1387 length:444 start_codon:yes stop_codon:yes gene_type:complete
MKNVVLITGGFDPIHSGHLEYIRAAKDKGDVLVIGLQSDEWLKNKKGVYFLPFKERCKVLEAIRHVDKVISFDDSDGTACRAIEKVKGMYNGDNIIFANGGDRTPETAPPEESDIQGVTYLWGVGGEKTNSSSVILKKYLDAINKNK